MEATCWRARGAAKRRKELAHGQRTARRWNPLRLPLEPRPLWRPLLANKYSTAPSLIIGPPNGAARLVREAPELGGAQASGQPNKQTERFS